MEDSEWTRQRTTPLRQCPAGYLSHGDEDDGDMPYILCRLAIVADCEAPCCRWCGWDDATLIRMRELIDAILAARREK